MSHTDKTDPRWVRAMHHPRRKLLHGWDCELYNHRRYISGWADKLHPCEGPVETQYKYRWDKCRWELPDDEPHYYCWYTPTREDRRLYWYGGARGEERAKLRETAKYYRANGEVDHVELEHQQHRHGVSWYLD